MHSAFSQILGLSQSLCKPPNGCKIRLLSLEVLLCREKKESPQKAAIREMMRSDLKDNDIRIKNETDVNAVTRDMMSFTATITAPLFRMGTCHFFYRECVPYSLIDMYLLHPTVLSRPCRKDPETFPYFKYSKTPPSTIFGINIDL